MKRLKQIFAALFATIAAVTVQAEPVAITQNLSSGDFIYSIWQLDDGTTYARLDGTSITGTPKLKGAATASAATTASLCAPAATAWLCSK